MFSGRYHVQCLRRIALRHSVGLVDPISHAVLKVRAVDQVALHLDRKPGSVDWFVTSVDMTPRRCYSEVIFLFGLVINHVDGALGVQAERMMNCHVCIPVGACRDVEDCTVRCAFELVQCASESFEEVAGGAVRCDAVGGGTARSL